MHTAQPNAGILLILEDGQKGVEEARVLFCLLVAVSQQSRLISLPR
jgi:hypothetical protein